MHECLQVSGKVVLVLRNRNIVRLFPLRQQRLCRDPQRLAVIAGDDRAHRQVINRLPGLLRNQPVRMLARDPDLFALLTDDVFYGQQPEIVNAVRPADEGPGDGLKAALPGLSIYRPDPLPHPQLLDRNWARPLRNLSRQ